LLSITHDAEIFKFSEKRKESSGLSRKERLSLTEGHYPTSSLGFLLGERYPFPPFSPFPMKFLFSLSGAWYFLRIVTSKMSGLSSHWAVQNRNRK